MIAVAASDEGPGWGIGATDWCLVMFWGTIVLEIPDRYYQRRFEKEKHPPNLEGVQLPAAPPESV